MIMKAMKSETTQIGEPTVKAELETVEEESKKKVQKKSKKNSKKQSVAKP